MFVRIGNIFLIIALLTAVGGQWAVLQSVAWVGMMANYSQNSSFKEAMVKTFDGQHPCCLCRAIAAAKKSQSKNDFTPPFQKIEFLPAKQKLVLIAPSKFQLLPQFNFAAKSFSQKPLLQPPRGFFV